MPPLGTTSSHGHSDPHNGADEAVQRKADQDDAASTMSLPAFSMARRMPEDCDRRHV